MKNVWILEPCYLENIDIHKISIRIYKKHKGEEQAVQEIEERKDVFFS